MIITLFPPLSLPALFMYPFKGKGKIPQKGTERTFKGAFPADQDIIIACVCLLWSNQAHCLAQTPFYTISHHRIAQLFGRGKTKERVELTLCTLFPAGLKNEARHGTIAPASGPQKISPFFQRLQPERHGPTCTTSQKYGGLLGRQSFAPAASASCQNLTTGLGGLAGAKTMAALAYKNAGLIGTFHVSSPGFANNSDSPLPAINAKSGSFGVMDQIILDQNLSRTQINASLAYRKPVARSQHARTDGGSFHQSVIEL